MDSAGSTHRTFACLVAVASLGFQGCGAIFNDLASKGTIKREPEVVYLLDGSLQAGDAMLLLNNDDHKLVAIAPDGRTGELRLTRRFSAGAVIGDVLWSLTILGVAAPISDLLLNTWFYVPANQVEVKLDQPAAVYADLGYRVTVKPASLPAPAEKPTASPPGRKR